MLCLFCQDCIIAIRGHNFQEGQAIFVLNNDGYLIERALEENLDWLRRPNRQADKINARAIVKVPAAAIIFLLRFRNTRGRPWTCLLLVCKFVAQSLGQRSQSGNGP